MKIKIGDRDINLNVKDPFVNFKTKKVRSDKKIRVNLSMDQKTHLLLNDLAKACDIPKTKLAYQIAFLMLRNTDFINFIQTKYQVSPADRIIPTFYNGKMEYKK